MEYYGTIMRTKGEVQIELVTSLFSFFTRECHLDLGKDKAGYYCSSIFM